MRTFLFALTLLIACGSSVQAEDQPPAPLPTDHQQRMALGLDLFKSEVRGVLVGRCLKCHGGESTEGEFDLTTRELLLRGGDTGPAILIGKAQQSRLVQMLSGKIEPQMPDDGAPLSATAQAAVARWIDLGAPYDRSLAPVADDPLAWTRRRIEPAQRKFWSFQPLAATTPPQGEGVDPDATEIDRYLQASLHAQQLAMNPPADRRTLIRRAYLDLIGWPPTPAEVDAFVADDDPAAFSQLLDRLLASPHYGERWARHWLDVSRFAESHGFEQDYDREFAFHFRDFVIRAFNQDMPFDQFAQWQIAGDELAPQEPLAMMATGFLGAGVFPTQITKNEVERTRYDALDDMAATTGVAFLGLTVGCARCHDHKFDPIPQADYYRFMATFTTAVRSNQKIDLDPAATAQEKAAFDQEHAPLLAALKAYEEEQLPARLAAWEQSEKATFQPDWLLATPVAFESTGGAELKLQADQSLLASGKNPDFDTYIVTIETSLEQIAGIRIEALADPSLPAGGPGRAKNGNIALSDLKATVTPLQGEGKPVALKLSNPKATFEQPRLEVAHTIDNNPKSAWAVDPQFGKDHAAVYQTTDSPVLPGGMRVTLTLHFANNKQHQIGRLRLSVAPRLPEPFVATTGGVSADILAALETPELTRTPAQRQTLLAWFAPQDPTWQKLQAAVQQHAARAPTGHTTTVMVVSEGVTPIRHHTQGADFFPETYFLHRGDTDQKATIAEQGFLQVLTDTEKTASDWQVSPPADVATSYRRTALAHWMTDTEAGAGQQLARVLVNRLWQHHFGRGIVATPNDFGYQGARPTHPELLDFLAARLIASGWRLKTLHKEMMLTAAWRQSSEFHATAAEQDPENALLWRFAPRRLEAEAIRDSQLQVGGLLDPTLYGPGTLDEDQKRRSIYFRIKRSKLIPSMQLFDSPEPLVSVGQRPATTIAPQALHFMNSDQARQCAIGLANRAQQASSGKQGADPDEVKPASGPPIEQAYRLALGRRPDAEELAAAVAFVEAQTASHEQAQQTNASQIALADFCQVLLSLNEFVYLE
ncbi:PSD1 and planctomycete cytochrome C domain-containing protein [Lignipirellula cremea]|uniref:Planctomycete cytochrome C n=1 Tax=Lignipirellula cremea TaxID=2528010 RepID=A0A518E3P4_9BACT|nr:PSD1 and planctomycete cytochrome C domain-containing protein [Lignipirellula cremea]QDU98709.1 Planctomycete cytochrome C [Lignipirellula cremea]